MDAAGKRKFIRELCNNVRDDLLKRVSDMPEEWDGHELRKLIADRFAEVVISDQMKTNRRRIRAYRNECLVRNLP